MGLDIFGTLVKRVRKNSSEPLNITIEEASKLADKRAKDRLSKFAKKSINILENTDADGYVDAYNKIFSKMKNYTRYEFTYERYYAESDIYFRKVNFVYRYFADKMEDECCFVTRGEMEDIVDRCERVLNNEGAAEELLPTMAGFFFGSTDYDNWYYKDVEDCKKQFSKMLKRFNAETDVFFMVFSW